MLLLCPRHRYFARRKLTAKLKPYALSSVLPEGRGGFSNSNVVAVTLSAFMTSADESISLRHVPSHRTNRAGVRKPIHENDKAVLSDELLVKAACVADV